MLVITISSGLSGTFETIKAVAEKINKEKITVFDSKFISLALTIFAIRAREKIKQGTNFEELI